VLRFATYSYCFLYVSAQDMLKTFYEIYSKAYFSIDTLEPKGVGFAHEKLIGIDVAECL
jgi:hypothetical protein